MDQTKENGNSAHLTRREMLKTTVAGILATGLIGGGVFGYLNRRSIWAVNNMLKMGHCAPSVMKTLLDVDGSYDQDIVRLAGPLSGGIGNSGGECGAITAGVIFLGLMNTEMDKIVSAGRVLMKEFRDRHGFIDCDKKPHGMRSCIEAISSSPERIAKLRESNITGISGAHQALLHEFDRHGFHCAKAVFHNLGITDARILNACRGFLGGTLLSGMTCSALTAGIMAIGLKKGRIENSYVRVFRMIRMMGPDDKWLGDEINNFNRSMNLGNRLHAWFKNTYGTCKCRKICGCSFDDEAEARRYVEKGGVRQCRSIAASVAHKVRESL